MNCSKYVYGIILVFLLIGPANPGQLLAEPICSDTNWCLENPQTDGDTTENIYDVWGLDDSTVYAVGARGTILKREGTEWIPEDSGTTNDLNAIWGNSAKDIYVVGDNNTVLHWDGDSWTPVEPAVSLYWNPDLYNWLEIWGSDTGNIYVAGNLSFGIIHIMRVVQFDGTEWLSLYDDGDTAPGGLWGSSDDDIYVVGNGSAFGDSFTMHFDGSSWNQNVFADPFTETFSVFSGTQMDVWGTDPSNVYITSDACPFNHYDGTDWECIDFGNITPKILSGRNTTEMIGASNWLRVLILSENKLVIEKMTQGMEIENYSVDILGNYRIEIYGLWVNPSGLAFVVGEGGVVFSKQAFAAPSEDEPVPPELEPPPFDCVASTMGSSTPGAGSVVSLLALLLLINLNVRASKRSKFSRMR